VRRYFNPDVKEVYSWWSFRARARQRNVGWRIDYFVVDNQLISDVENIEYLTSVLGSDHCPVLLKLKEKC
jgi:exodeoxyribonuclease-3